MQHEDASDAGIFGFIAAVMLPHFFLCEDPAGDGRVQEAPLVMMFYPVGGMLLLARAIRETAVAKRFVWS